MKKTASAIVVILSMSMMAMMFQCSNTVTYDNSNSLTLNYVVPSTPQPPNGYPAIIIFHGRGGSKEEMLFVANIAASQGFFAIAIDWREPDWTTMNMWPAQLEDAQNALNWLIRDTRYAANWSSPNPYTIDINRIGAVGFSIGGTISLMLTDINGPNIKAVAAFAGASNFEKEYRYLAFNQKEDQDDPTPLLPPMNVIVTEFLTRLLGFYKIEDINRDGKPDYDPDYFETSPINHIRASVPVLLIHGNLDIAVPPSQSRSLMNKIRSLGGKCDLFIFNSQHAFNPGLATDFCPSDEMDVNSGIKYMNTFGYTGLDLMFEFFQAKL